MTPRWRASTPSCVEFLPLMRCLPAPDECRDSTRLSGVAERDGRLIGLAWSLPATPTWLRRVYLGGGPSALRAMGGGVLPLRGDGLMLFPSYRFAFRAPMPVHADVSWPPFDGLFAVVAVPPDADTAEWEKRVEEEQGPQLDLLPLLAGVGRVGTADEIPWAIYHLRGLGWDLKTPATAELSLGTPLATWTLDAGQGWRMLPDGLPREALTVAPRVEPHPLPCVVLDRALGQDEAAWALVEIEKDAIFGSPRRRAP